MKNIPYNLKLKDRAREMRKNMTEAEKKLWFELLVADKFHGLRFLRQKPIDNFIVDFYCSKLRLVIEVDGDSHFSEQGEAYDEERTFILNKYGIEVIRYNNNDIFNNIEGVGKHLESVVRRRMEEINPLNPLSQGDLESSNPLNPFHKGTWKAVIP